MTPVSMATRGLGGPLAVCFVWALMVTGCGGGAPAQSPASGASHAESATPPAPGALAKAGNPAIMPKDPEPGPSLPPLTYEAKGRRDPFLPVSVAREKAGLSVTTFKLAGVIRGRVLLALVEAPDGIGYILKPGDVLGDGRITNITPNSVTFAVSAKLGQPATTVTLTLGGD